jgi:membrane dipeptidase
MYPGQILVTHSNAQALLKESKGNRHVSDRLIQGVLERDGVIGIVFYNPYLQAGWRRGDPREQVTLQNVVAQIDYICQMAGDARHAGIGSDFDGGLGVQSVPTEIDTIADLQLLAPMLGERGYSEDDIAAIFGQNWLERLRRILPYN